jgi:hypothetical protein
MSETNAATAPRKNVGAIAFEKISDNRCASGMKLSILWFTYWQGFSSVTPLTACTSCERRTDLSNASAARPLPRLCQAQIVILSGASGEDAKPYQEKQVRNALSGN